MTLIRLLLQGLCLISRLDDLQKRWSHEKRKWEFAGGTANWGRFQKEKPRGHIWKHARCKKQLQEHDPLVSGCLESDFPHNFVFSRSLSFTDSLLDKLVTVFVWRRSKHLFQCYLNNAKSHSSHLQKNEVKYLNLGWAACCLSETAQISHCSCVFMVCLVPKPGIISKNLVYFYSPI